MSDYTDLIPLAKADYAAALQDAATELQSASGLVNSFGDAAQAYADDESNATTDQLNATATAAVDAPKKAAAAISNVESVYRSAGGNVCS